jgi:ubiquitin-protein ligase
MMTQSSTEVHDPGTSTAGMADQTTGGFFRARLTFPSEYPLLPPKMRFETPIFHPNSERLLHAQAA